MGDPEKTDKSYTSERVDHFKQITDEDKFKAQYNRCKWHFLDESRFTSWTKTLAAIRLKVKMINTRKSKTDPTKPRLYDLLGYNCQTTSRELALVIGKSPAYLNFRMNCIANAF